MSGEVLLKPSGAVAGRGMRLVGGVMCSCEGICRNETKYLILFCHSKVWMIDELKNVRVTGTRPHSMDGCVAGRSVDKGFPSRVML